MSGSRYYLAYDQVGSLRVVADSSGNVVKKIDYDTFGNILADSYVDFTIPLGFAGGLHDRDTGLVRFGYRDYDPDTGRWTAKDPIGFNGGDIDLYGYCLNNPVNLVDQMGLEAWIIVNRIGNQGTISAVDSDGNRASGDFFDAGRGTGKDPYGTNLQIPPGTYTVTPRPANLSHPGRPTLSNTSNWNKITTPCGTDRFGVQLHKGSNPSHSQGCLVSPNFNAINDVIKDDYNKGGVTIIIIDVGMFDVISG